MSIYNNNMYQHNIDTANLRIVFYEQQNKYLLLIKIKPTYINQVYTYIPIKSKIFYKFIRKKQY